MLSFFWKKKKQAAPVAAAVVPWSDGDEIPRYPPFMKGLPVVSPERLVGTQEELIKRIRNAAVATPEMFDTHYLPAIHRFASFVHLLPASQAHHHRGAGGLLRHALEVGLWALQAADKIMVKGAQSPAQRREMEPRWQLAVFLAGLCHDAGKPVTDVTITNEERSSQWNPLTEGLYDWAKRNHVRAYFFDWREGRGRQHTALSSLVGERIIGVESLAWIGGKETELVAWIMESLANNPSPKNQLHDLIVKADQASVERDLKTLGAAMAGYDLGIPVERHLTDMMRRMVREGVWIINEPGARVWNIEGGIYLVWPAGGEDMARQAREDGVPGIPRTPDGILSMLLERELAYMMEGDNGPMHWQIAPAVLAQKIPDIKLKAIRLRDDTLVSALPVAMTEGKVIGRDAPVEPQQGGAAGEEVAAVASGSRGSQEGIVPDTNELSAVEPGGGIAPAVERGRRGGKGAKAGEPSKETGRATETRDEENAADGALKTPVSKGGDAKPTSAASASTSITALVERPVVFDGATGEAIKALAQDVREGQDKQWGREVIRDGKDGMLRLRWPAAFAGYGLTGKAVLEDMAAKRWLIFDPLSPLKKTILAHFADSPESQPAIQLSAGATAAFLALAGEAMNSPAAEKESHAPESALESAPTEQSPEATPEVAPPAPSVPPSPQSGGQEGQAQKGQAQRKGKKSAKHPLDKSKPRKGMSSLTVTTSLDAQTSLPLTEPAKDRTSDPTIEEVIAALKKAPITMEGETCITSYRDALAIFKAEGLPIEKYQVLRRLSERSEGRLKVMPNMVKFKV